MSLLDEARTFAGYRAAQVNPASGATIVVVDGWEQGLESPGDGGPRWFTICLTHEAAADDCRGDTTVGHYTLADAKHFMRDPQTWCGGCQDASSYPSRPR